MDTNTNPNPPARGGDYDAVARQLVDAGIRLSEKVCIVRGDPYRDATCLYLLPVRWFIAVRSQGRLFTGIYDVSMNFRLQGTEDREFKDVDPAWLDKEIRQAASEKLVGLLDKELVEEFLAAGFDLGGRR
jgi:hypothetical protein